MVLSPDVIQKLSVPERLALIEALWGSIADASMDLPITDAQRHELGRWLDRYAHDLLSRAPAASSDDRTDLTSVTMVKHRSEDEEEQLVEKYIGLDNERYGGRADARLRSGPSIWAIVSYLGIYNGDRDEIAGHFGISQEEIDAALAFYRRNKKYIDARITLNEA